MLMRVRGGVGDGGRRATRFLLPPVRLKPTGRGLTSVAATWGQSAAASQKTAKLLIGVMRRVNLQQHATSALAGWASI